jgi:hypothetical protein
MNVSANFPVLIIQKHVPCTCLALGPRRPVSISMTQHILSILVHEALIQHLLHLCITDLFHSGTLVPVILVGFIFRDYSN